MKLHEEIAKVAHELYEKSGGIEGRDLENWLDAERIVRTRHQGKESSPQKQKSPDPVVARKPDIKKTATKKNKAK